MWFGLTEGREGKEGLSRIANLKQTGKIEKEGWWLKTGSRGNDPEEVKEEVIKRKSKKEYFHVQWRASPRDEREWGFEELYKLVSLSVRNYLGTVKKNSIIIPYSIFNSNEYLSWNNS